MPSSPYQYRTQGVTFDLLSLSDGLVEADAQRQLAYVNSRTIQRSIVKAKLQLDMAVSTVDIDEELATIIESVAPKDSGADRKPREANLSNRIEDYVRYKAFQHFLLIGNLLPPSEVPYATDEEYLGGACMGLCHDLARYGMGRATARDFDSVVQASDLVQQLLDYFLMFDFRNGPLRRKYDATKYALKNLETILYELSITGAKPTETAPKEGDDAEAKIDQEPATKRRKSESNLPQPELDGIRERMAARDEQRENLIKKSRDGQKAAKQAIYALHRGDLQRATALIEQCKDCITNDLMPIVEAEPPLRHGSFAGVLEEYVEAKLFYVWLYGAGEPSADGIPNCKILGPTEFDIPIQPEDYLGGICDLTGEVGRYAVQRGTARDTESVRKCLDANSSIYEAIQSLERVPGVVGKKSDQLRRSVEKLERMLYEMSLSEAAGGRAVQSEEHTEA